MKKLTLMVAVVMVSVLAMMFGVACDDSKKPPVNNSDHDYCVTVLGLDGQTYTNACIQPCIVVNGELGTCIFIYKKAGADGKIYFDNGVEIKDEEVTEIEAHVYQGEGTPLPAYMTYDETRIKKGESKTVQLRAKKDSELNSLDGNTGDGTAELEGENLKAGATLKPYEIPFEEEQKRFAYKLDLTGNKKVYFKINTESGNNYRVYAYDNASAKVSRFNNLARSEAAGYNVTGSDQISFTSLADNSAEYFEVSLADGATSTTVIICFEFDLMGNN